MPMDIFNVQAGMEMTLFYSTTEVWSRGAVLGLIGQRFPMTAPGAQPQMFTCVSATLVPDGILLTVKAD